MRFRVQLDGYAGPLDLLLYLVRKHEVDVLELSITRVVDQYLELLAVLEQIDIGAVGDFLDVATRLMEIKARSMLPQQDEGDEEVIDDSRQELVARLLEYKRYKEAAALLEDRSRQWQQRFARRTNDLDDGPVDPAEQPIQDVELWDLVSAFSRVLRERAAAKPARIRHDETPVEHYMRHIESRLAAERRMAFAALFASASEKSAMIGLFLALLELVRHARARVEHAAAGEELWITLPAADNPLCATEGLAEASDNPSTPAA